MTQGTASRSLSERCSCEEKTSVVLETELDQPIAPSLLPWILGEIQKIFTPEYHIACVWPSYLDFSGSS